MEELELKPHQEYFLKWMTYRITGAVHKMVVLKCEFIHYYDNRFRDQYFDYMYNEVEAPELTGTIYDQNGYRIHRQFDDPLYPYRIRTIFQEGIFGLFRVISLTHGWAIIKGKKNTQNQELFVYNVLDENNVTMNTSSIIYNQTLMWVNLATVDILPATNQLTLLQGKAVDTFDKFPGEVKSTVKSYLGGKTKKRNRHKQFTKKRNCRQK